jgi:hypothetical protein
MALHVNLLWLINMKPIRVDEEVTL